MTVKIQRQKITPCLWFDDQAEEAARFYVSLFDDSEVGTITHYDAASAAASGRPEGSVLTVDFRLAGQPFMALNGGPQFKFTEAVSLSIDCDDQAEVDHFWDGLLAGGGETQACGWLKDRYGLSWQVVPSMLPELLSDPDPAKASRVMKAMLDMVKLDVAELERAAAGGGD